ncbi:MAG: hypothetical protein AB8B65_20430 [Kordia sp.]|uniref:hypothetical protein n=1 Tax=Kordia sp. TaxID=1965332 RepID=UPI00385FB8DB
MKKVTKQNLKLTKTSIAKIDRLTINALKGGTDTVSDDLPAGYRMTDLPDHNGICYAIQ